MFDTTGLGSRRWRVFRFPRLDRPLFLPDLALLFIAFTFIVVLGRCGWLQIVEGDERLRRQQRETSRRAWRDARHGSIFTERGMVLARDVSRWKIAIDPSAASRIVIDGEPRASAPGRLSHAIDRVLEIEGVGWYAPLDVLRRRAVEGYRAGRQYLPLGVIAEGVHLANFNDRRKQLRTVFGREVLCDPEEFFVREYPLHDLAVQLVGNESLDREMGLYGIEARWHSTLEGRRGLRRTRTDATGAREFAGGVSSGVEPQMGKDLSLTLDVSAQWLLEDLLAETLERTRGTGVSGLVMDPRNGALLAAASVPKIVRGDLRRLFNAGLEEEARKLLFQGTRRVMEPGSVVKPLVLAAALESGISLEDTVDVNNEWKVIRNGRSSRTIRDTHLLEPRFRTVAGSVVKSSNIGIVEVGLRTGRSSIHDVFERLGFGARTGIDLLGEEVGSLKAVEDWSWYTLTSASFGYELGVTQLQMACAYCAIANGGFKVTPHLVRRVDGVRCDPAPGPRVLSATIASMVCQTLRDVVLEGTGSRLNEVIGLAGKTGTAMIASVGGYEEGAYISSFIGFAPWDDPQRLAMVVVERPQGRYYASEVAAPVVSELLGALLAAPGNRLEHSVDRALARPR